MKKLKIMNLLLTLLGCLFIPYSCSDNNSVEPDLKVSKTEMSFSAVGEVQSIYVQSNVDFTATSSADWLTLSPSSGQGTGHVVELKITAANNSSTDTRTALILIKAGEKTQTITVTQSYQDLLIVANSSYSVDAAGGNITVNYQVSGTYDMTIGNDWITESATKATSSLSKTFTIGANRNHFARKGIIVFSLGNNKDTVVVNQAASQLTIASDATGMSSDAKALSAKMGIGWNLGNSLEACSSSTVASETMWGNPKTTKTLIDAVKSAGFNTIRIPCAWSGYMEDQTTYKIKDSWFARVKEVVDYCIANNMYVILNSHWDGGWRDENPFYAQQSAINEKQKALWEQIAVYFRDYDEHLIFAGTNEVGHDASTAPTAENITVQMSFNQTFVDAVRSTGGKNTYRNLLVQAYNTNIDLAVSSLKMPTDATSNRLMAEIHYYDPSDYCILTEDASWATMKYYWGKEAGYDQYGAISSWGQEDWARTQFAKLKTNFIDKNIPVIMGEFGNMYREIADASKQAHVTASRNYYLKYITSQAIANGVVPVYWDNGVTGNNGNGLFNRNTGEQAHADAISALIHATN